MPLLRPALVALAVAAAAAANLSDWKAAIRAGEYAPVNSTILSQKFDPVKGAAATSKFLTKFKSSSWDTPEFPPGVLTCWVDERTGVILGLDDGRGLRCGNGEGKATQIPLPGNKFVEAIEVGVIPKTDFLGHLKFFISAYNATKLDLPTVAECGNATLTTVGFSGQGAQVDSVLFNAQRIAKKLVDTKNITTVKSQELYGPHLAATRVGKCLTDRYAPPRFAANKTTDSAATVAAAALASLKPTLKINSSIDAKSLDPTFTPRTCKSQMLCSPEGSVTVADSGCQPSAVGNTFVLVNDGTPVDSVACAPAGVVGNVGYQELTPGESSDCVLTNTCELPLQAPEDNLVGGVCVVGGLESPCYSQGEGCPPGQIQITDEAGTCTTGFCCASPTCPVPNQLCGGTTCVDTQTDEANCGFCGTPCPNNPDVVCDGGQCQCTDGTPIASGADVQLLAQGTTRVGEESVDTFALSTPTCSVGASPCSCTLVYDSQSIPDRYIVRSGDVCSTLVFDTGFTGLVSSGCAASAPCCEASLGGGCTGTKGDFCPPNMPSTPGGGGPGAGSATFVVPAGQPLFVTAYGVCGNTVNEFSLTCCDGPGPCP